MDNDTTPATTPHWMAPRSHSHLLSAFLVTLNILLIILLFLYLYKFFWQKQSDPNSQSNPYDDTNSTFSSPPTSPRNGRGHELQFINSLPMIEFKNTSSEKVECAVCLSEFKDGEKARVLPKCDHQFHVECVDRWFKSNTNCPLCRTPVESNDHAALDTVV